MKKTLTVLLALILLSGCAAGPAAQIADKAQIVAPTLAPSSPMPMPTVVSSTPSAALSPEPTPDANMPVDTEAPVYPDALESPDPGPGLPLNDIVVADQDNIYYYDNLPFPKNDNDPRQIALYEMSRKTHQVTRIDTITRNYFTLQQIFLDANGNLYYYLENMNDDLTISYEIYRYHKPTDELVCIATNPVERVDSRYIYMGDTWYSFKDGKLYSGDPSLYTKWNTQEDIESHLSGAITNFKITNTAGEPEYFSINQEIDDEIVVDMYNKNGKLFVLTDTLDNRGSLIYVIDISQSVVLDKIKVYGQISCTTAYNGMLYFASEIFTDEDYPDVNLYTNILSLNLSTAKVSKIKKIGYQEGEDEGLSLTVCGGYLWGYSEGGGDLDACWGPFMISKIKE